MILVAILGKMNVMIKYAIITALLACGVYWYSIDVCVQPGVAQVCPAKIKAAIYRMGPGKQYRLFPDGTLQVKVENQWLNLRY